MIASRGDFDKLVTEALINWAKNHPYPDDFVLFLADGKALTPRQLAREVEQRTPFGIKQLEVLRHFAEAEKLDAQALIRMFTVVAVSV